MFVYIIGKDTDFTLNTPFVSDFSQIKNKAEQFPDKILLHSEYPNGLILDMTQTAEQIVVCSNMELIKADDGSYNVREG